MTLSLDITKDTAVPSAAFKSWALQYLSPDKIKSKYDSKFISGLFQRNKDLQKKLGELVAMINRAPAGRDVWFAKMFLWPFGGKETDDAKKFFSELEKQGAFTDLEDTTTKENKVKQTNGTNLAAACASALVFLEDTNSGLPAVVGKLSTALSTTAAPPAPATPALTPEQTNLAKGFINSMNNTPPNAELVEYIKKQPAPYNSTYNAEKPDDQLRMLKLLRGRLSLVRGPAKALTNTLTALRLTLAQAQTMIASIVIPETKTFSSLDILLESGVITQEDYDRTSNRLLGKILSEAALTPSDIAANKAKFDGYVSSVTANCTTLASQLKALQTLGQKLAAASVTESFQRQVLKSHIKKRILQETAGKDSREQLNEFFLIAALLAALTGAIAWATSKISGFFKDSYYGRGTPTYPAHDPKDVTKAIQAFGDSTSSAYGPDGIIVTMDGRRVPDETKSRKAIEVETDLLVASLEKAQALFTALLDEATSTSKGTVPGGGDPGRTEALIRFLGGDPNKAEPVRAALLPVVRYDIGGMRAAVGAVKTKFDQV